MGDSINDIAAGTGAGVVTVGCTFGYGEADELADAEYRIASLPELLTLTPLKAVRDGSWQRNCRSAELSCGSGNRVQAFIEFLKPLGKCKVKRVPSGSLLAKVILPFEEFLSEQLDAVRSDSPSLSPFGAEGALEKLQLHLLRHCPLIVDGEGDAVAISSHRIVTVAPESVASSAFFTMLPRMRRKIAPSLTIEHSGVSPSTRFRSRLTS